MRGQSEALLPVAAPIFSDDIPAAASHQSLEIDEEAGEPEQHEAAKSSDSSCFPFKMCPCLPSYLIPLGLQVIQDQTHLALAILIIQSLLVCFRTLAMVTTQFFGLWSLRNLLGSREVLAAFGSAIIIPWCFAVVKQYDQRLTDKKNKLLAAQETLRREYKGMVAGMQGFLDKFVRYNTDMAENMFESKFRSFSRWLQHVKHYIPHILVGSDANRKEVIGQFRLICLRWFDVLRECSIDPENAPCVEMTLEDLNLYETIEEICDACLAKLVDPPKVAVAIKESKQQMADLLSSKSSEVSKEDSEGALRIGGKNRRLTRVCCCNCSWLTIDRCQLKCCSKNADAEDGLPWTCGFLCVLAQVHSICQAKLMASWVAHALVFALHAAAIGAQSNSSSERHVFVRYLGNTLFTLSYLICLTIVLARFEDIDIVQQMVVEVREIDKRKQEIGDKRDEMKEFWDNIEELNAVWLYRTIPRLDLLESVSHKLEDCNKEDLAKHLAASSVYLGDLEKKVGSLEDWKRNGSISEERKQAFARHVKDAYMENELDGVFSKLHSSVRMLGNVTS